MIRAAAALLLALAAVASVSCTPSALRARGPGDGSASAALYRARFDPGGGEQRRKFRLLVYAADPDRLHGEVLSAIGTTELVIDAGGGSVSLFFVRDRIAFAGAADPASLERLLGIRLAVEDFVAMLLGSASAQRTDGWSVERDGAGFASAIRFDDGTRKLELTLRRERPIRADLSQLGTGKPPDGVEVRPLDSLDAERLPGVEVDEGDVDG